MSGPWILLLVPLVIVGGIGGALLALALDDLARNYRR